MKRKKSKTGNEPINELTLKWVHDANARCVNVTGPLIKEKALQFACELNNEDFKASNGWLESFLQRNNLCSSQMQGERGDVDDKVVND
jgi:hypothetical protein